MPTSFGHVERCRDGCGKELPGRENFGWLSELAKTQPLWKEPTSCPPTGVFSVLNLILMREYQHQYRRQRIGPAIRKGLQQGLVEGRVEGQMEILLSRIQKRIWPNSSRRRRADRDVKARAAQAGRSAAARCATH